MSKSISPWFSDEQKQTVIENTKKYKIYRVQLACILRDLFQKYNVPFFIEGGTALGAYRNGKMIPHDDDFDYALHGDEELLVSIQQKLEHDLPEEYKVRTVMTYCKKLEIYQPQYGKIMLDENIDFHNVTVDFLLYKDHTDDDSIQIQYFKRSCDKLRIPKTAIFPLTTIEFENQSFPCPNDLEAYLKIYYGYLGEDAYYDPETNMYKKSND